MAKIMHGKSLRDLDTDKEYLVYYYGSYLESIHAATYTCEGFGKIKYRWNDSKWMTTLYARGSNIALTIVVTVTRIDSSFIIEL